MRVYVKQEHIDKGLRGDPNYCPIALSIIDAKNMTIPSNDYPLGITSGYIRVREGNETICYKVSRRANKFIRDFDAGKKVKPFNFNLNKLNPDFK